MSEDLKFVMLYSAKESEYSIHEHNLNKDEATDIATDLRIERLPAFVADQERFHAQEDAAKCLECQQEVVRLFEQWARVPRFKK